MQTMKSTFLYQDTQLPAYLQFPEFLLRLPISQTAKVVYLVLYDRSRLSMKNEWTDEYGRVYVVFPIVELAKKIGKSESTVKAGLKELCEAGLLVKRSGGFSKPNYLYVKYVIEGQFSDRVRKASALGSKSNTSDSQDSDPSTGRYPAPNKVMNHSNPTDNYGVMDRKPKGRYGNIFLSDKELTELEAEFAGNIERYVEELSEYVASTGRTYVNYAAAIRRWAANDRKVGEDRAFEDYECKKEDSF